MNGRTDGYASVQLLGGFAVVVGRRTVTAGDFERPLAAHLVKLLALADGHSLHREQVIDVLWPDRTVEQAAPQLHKMASYVRKGLGDKTAITFRDEAVVLLPDADLQVDVDVFEAAVARGDASAADLYTGDLLPDDLYEDWVGPARDRLRTLLVSVLRDSELWDRVLEVEPADEHAHLAKMKMLMERGQRLAALRQFERLEAALHEDLGVSPSDEAMSLRAQIVGDIPERPELIGREDERFTLRRLLDDAQREAGSLVVLSGSAGIGKTALANWIADRAGEAGFAVGRSAAATIDDPRPYLPILEAIDAVLRGRPALLAELPETHRDELMRVREAGQSEHARPEDGDGHQRLFVAVDAVIESAARTDGVLLLVDDLDLADQASLDLLQYLARRARRHRVLLVATARSSSGAGGIEAVRRVVSAAAALEVQVGPLADADARELVTRLDADGGSIDSLIDLAGGTPFYLEELARVSASGGHLPNRVANLAHASLGTVDHDVRDALRRIAIVGQRFDTDQFLALSGVDEDTAFGLLDRALSCEVVEHTPAGYRFRHGLVRESLLDELAPHQRRQIHRDAAGQFETSGAPPARVAHHLIEAGDRDRAAPWALVAAQAAASVGALADARAAIDPVIDHADSASRFGLLLVRADAMAGMSDLGAVAAYHEAIAESPPEMVAPIKAKMALAFLMQGQPDAARDVLDGVEPDGGPFDGHILRVKGILAYVNRDLEAADTMAAEMRQMALSNPTNARLIDAVALESMVAHDRGEWFDRVSHELTTTAHSSELASTVFDCHL